VIPFAAYTTAESPNAIQVAALAQKLPLRLHCGGCRLHCNTLLLGPTRASRFEGLSIGSAVFAQHIRVTSTQTDTQTTLRATYVAIGRTYAVHAVWPNSCAVV